MAQTEKKKELCIRCGKKPPAMAGELWCNTCYNKLLKNLKIKPLCHRTQQCKR